VLWRWVEAQEQIYRRSVSGQAPPWIADYLDMGKPQELVQFCRMKRFRDALPRVLRPDLLLTDDGFRLTELDAVPGGIGFTAAMNQAYRDAGMAVIDAPGPGGMVAAFGELLASTLPATAKDGCIAVVVSDEAADYRLEFSWLVTTLQRLGYPVRLAHPRDLWLSRDALVLDDGTPVDGIYRFFELFDLPNIPKSQLVQYASKKGWVRLTPPWKTYLEEKLWLALLHHPAMVPWWRDTMPVEDFLWLQSRVPPAWVLDPRPLPPHAVIPGLMPDGQGALQDLTQLGNFRQKERTLVLKPSGFSPLAWGSRGVTVGHDVSSQLWQQRLSEAMAAFPQGPWLLQQFAKPKTVPFARFNPSTGEVHPFDGRARLCPYFFVSHNTPELVGVLATLCPPDKKVIHGMSVAVMAPCGVQNPTP
jgi:hypothetical protein